MVESKCKQCGNDIMKAGYTPGVFCNRKCKGDWQMDQKPWTKEWLYQKYIIEKMSTADIGKIVKRNPKQVYFWLKGFNIKLRTRKEGTTIFNTKKSTRKLRSESGQRPMSEEQKKKLSDIAIGKPRPCVLGSKNGMYGRTGSSHPNWKGGGTPERQSFYVSLDWKNMSKKIWKKYNSTCQSCNTHVKDKKEIEGTLHIHHLKSFTKYPEDRLSENNLILVCKSCHQWIHSNKNTKKEYIND